MVSTRLFIRWIRPVDQLARCAAPRRLQVRLPRLALATQDRIRMDRTKTSGLTTSCRALNSSVESFISSVRQRPGPAAPAAPAAFAKNHRSNLRVERRPTRGSLLQSWDELPPLLPSFQNWTH